MVPVIMCIHVIGPGLRIDGGEAVIIIFKCFPDQEPKILSDYIVTIRDTSFENIAIKEKEQPYTMDNTSQLIYSTCSKDKPKRFLKQHNSKNTILRYKNNYHANSLV